MAFYTPDGIRHESKEEALIHTQDFLLTELPPTEDKIVQAVHKHDWGRFEIQSTPNESGFYAELAESTVSVEEEEGAVSRGYNLLKYSQELTGTETPEQIIDSMEQDKRFVSMVGHEVKALLDELTGDDNYFYDETTHDLVVTYSSYVGNDLFANELHYSIDNNSFNGFIECKDNQNNLEELLMHIRSQFIIEVEGEYDSVSGKIDGYDMFTIVDNASLSGKQIRITVQETPEEEA